MYKFFWVLFFNVFFSASCNAMASAGKRAKLAKLVRHDEPTSCVGCLSDFEGDAEDTILKSLCSQNHAAHKECAARWLIANLKKERKTLCPMCREPWDSADLSDAIDLSDDEFAVVSLIRTFEEQELQRIKASLRRKVRGYNRYNLRNKRARLAPDRLLCDVEALEVSADTTAFLIDFLQGAIEKRWPRAAAA